MDKWEGKEYDILVDKKAGFNYETFNYLVTLGKWCANKLAQYRPEMKQVYENINDSRKQFYMLSSQI